VTESGQSSTSGSAEPHDAPFADLLLAFLENILALHVYLASLRPVAQRLPPHLSASMASHWERLMALAKDPSLRTHVDLFQGQDPTSEDEVVMQRIVSVLVDDPARHLPELLSLVLGTVRSARMLDLLHRSALVTLVSFFNDLLADLYRLYYRLRPQALSSDDKVLSVNELRGFADLEEAIAALISRRVEGLLRGSLEDQRIFLLKQLKMDLQGMGPDRWGRVVEIHERRNLLVHNNGVVNDVYLRKTASLDLGGTDRPTRGDTLDVPAAYIDDAVDLIGVLGVRLIVGCSAKLTPHDADDLDDLLSLHVLDLMRADRWWMVEQLSADGVAHTGEGDGSCYIHRVNYWLACKRQGRWDEVAPAVEACVSTLGEIEPPFAIAVHSLRDDPVAFYRDLDAAVASGIDENDLRTWPIFDEMRQDDAFEATLARLFNLKDHAG